MACLRPPGPSSACQDPVRIPASSPQLFSASFACSGSLGCAAWAKWLELIQSSWSFSSPFTSLWLGPPLTFLYCGMPRHAGDRAGGPAREVPQMCGHHASSLSACFSLPAPLFPKLLSFLKSLLLSSLFLLFDSTKAIAYMKVRSTHRSGLAVGGHLHQARSGAGRGARC